MSRQSYLNGLRPMDENSLESNWNTLKTTFAKILNKNSSGHSFEELYRSGYEIVTRRRANKFYEGLQKLLSEHLQEKVCPKIEAAINSSLFLETLRKEWEGHSTAMVMIRDVSLYVDRNYTQPNQLTSTYDLGLKAFREEIIGQSQINGHLKEILFGLISKERNYEAIEWFDLKSAIQMFLVLGFENDRQYYEQQFEHQFLEESRKHFHKLAGEFLQENNATIYIQKVNQCLSEEKERADRYLDKITEEKLLNIAKGVLIEKNLSAIIEMQHSGLVVMLEKQRIDDLKGLYELANLIDSDKGIDVMTKALSKYLRECGKNLINLQERPNPLQLIEDLLKLNDQFGMFLTRSFANDKKFKITIDDDFTFFFNSNPKNAEYLSVYIDEKLRKGRKNLSDNEIEHHLSKAMILFKLLEDKDVFERYYKNHLAKRLLYDRSISEESEKLMISKLKTECGCQFTGKLNRMLVDVSLKDELSRGFRESQFDCIDTTAMVLTTVVWPMFPSTTFDVPPELENVMTKFTQYYQSRHNGRHLSYLLPNCRGELVASCFPKRYIFVATTAQISILYMYNSDDTYNFVDIRDGLKMKHELAISALQAIVKAEILSITQGSLEKSDAVLKLNTEFQNKKFKVDLAKFTGKTEARKESEQVQKEIDDDRRYVVQAAIMRVMKMRKVLKHSQLIAEILSQLASRFNPKIPLIKKSIDTLIEREFLKRQDNDYESIEYIA